MNPLPPDIHRLARRRAHELRNAAIDEAFRRLGRWLRRLASRRPAPMAASSPCHS